MIGEAVRQLETLSEMMNRRMPEPGTMAICEALAELVRLKNHKDTVGKDAEYLEAQPKAWDAARQALAQPIVDEVTKIIDAVIERAEQACRYALKHKEFEGRDEPYMKGYASGWEVGASVCEHAIREFVMLHIFEDIHVQAR